MWDFPTVKSETHFFLFVAFTALGFFGEVNDFPFIFDGFLIEKSRPMLKVSLNAACLFLWKGPGLFIPPHKPGGGGGNCGERGGVNGGNVVGGPDGGLDGGLEGLGKGDPNGEGVGGGDDGGIEGDGNNDGNGDGLGDGLGDGYGLDDGDVKGEPLGDGDANADGDPDPLLPEEGLGEAKTPITDMILGDDGAIDAGDVTARDTSDGLNAATEGIDWVL